NVDLVVGNIIKEDNDRRVAGKYTGTIKKYNNGRLLIENPREYLINAGMRVQSIQALIVKTSVIVDNDLIMVEGAAGQDTMFFQELVLNCNRIQGLNKFIHVYYTAVAGSVTNTEFIKYFEQFSYLIIAKISLLISGNITDV